MVIHITSRVLIISYVNVCVNHQKRRSVGSIQALSQFGNPVGVCLLFAPQANQLPNRYKIPDFPPPSLFSSSFSLFPYIYSIQSINNLIPSIEYGFQLRQPDFCGISNILLRKAIHSLDPFFKHRTSVNISDRIEAERAI